MSEECCQINRFEEKKLTEGGWLGSDGICHFDEEDKAFPAGETCRNGKVIYIDGNGEHFTRQAYMKRYPAYPDPALVLKLKAPKKHFIRLGRP